MSFFNAIYTLGGCRRRQPIIEDSRVTIEAVNRKPCAQVTAWAKWAITYPISAAHSAYNFFLIAKYKEYYRPIVRQVYSGNAINYMPLSIIPGKGKSLHIISSPAIIQAVAHHYRNDPHGVFQEKEEDKLFLPLLQDLFEKDKASKEDFIFTCSVDAVAILRNPMVKFLAPRKQLKSDLDKVISVEILDWLAQKEVNGVIKMSASELTQSLTVTVLARLFLNHPGNIKDFQSIGNAASFALNFQVDRQLKKPSFEQLREYNQALEVLRSAIEVSMARGGEFVDSLRKSGLSDIRIKSELLAVYAAGSDTTYSSLQYILWRLGKHLDYQEKIFRELNTSPDCEYVKLNAFVSECFRLYTPAYIFGRTARQDLVITVKNKNGRLWQYPIWKGEGILCSPFLAGRSEQNFQSASTFQPDRIDYRNNPFPTKVFSEYFQKCPGMGLARAEIENFLTVLLQKYAVASFPEKEELSMKGFTTLKLEEVTLTLSRRS